MAEFVHLHLHTEFSLLDGACRIPELMDAAAKSKVPALAVTEHGNMFSAISFHDEARRRGIKPILGCEVYVAPGSRLTKSGPVGETANHLVLLAENLDGYHNLIKLVSSGYTDGFYYRPRIDKDLLATHASGLIGLSSCLKGEVATGLRKDQDKKALEAAATYRDILGSRNFFLEMQYQGIEDQLTVNKGLLPIARDLELPLVCTNDVHYLKQGDHVPHDVLLCIGTGKTVQQEDRLKYHGDQFYLKSPTEMAERFGDYPEALLNTVNISERCNVKLAGRGNHLPNFSVPPSYTLESYFEHEVREGYKRRLPRLKRRLEEGQLKDSLEAYEARLQYEINTIVHMNYSGYFLIVWDFIRHARERNIPVGPGRGSAAGSLVAYCLHITDVDPLEFDLIFERFLNPERVSLPDIDIDFCERRRGEIIDYVTQKYGRENVAQIITFGTMKARAAVRDVGRALNMSYSEVDRVAKQIPSTLDITLDRALKENAELRELRGRDARVKELLDVARRLEGMHRHASVHAAGVVIAPSALTEFVPLYKSQRDEITTQWAMKDIERIGLLKMDFLGLSTLTLLDDCVKAIRSNEVDNFALDTIPLNDGKTFKLFSEGQTLGIFQFESSGMRDTLRKAQPQRLDDLIALNALYRPGPLRGGVIDDFIARRHGKTPIKYEVPELEPILHSTYGVIAYQEQVMRIANDLAGFSMGEADLLRKAMGKKDAQVMEEQRDRFMKGAVERGISKTKASKLFNLIEHFAGYGFNKSHSTAYALLAYQTAYLKANYCWYFMAALLTIESENPDKLALYLRECRDLGVQILSPDISTCDIQFTVTPEGVRYGLAAVRNVGESAITSILSARKAGNGIRSLFSLCEMVDLRLVNKRVLESLVKAGAFDFLQGDSGGGTRRFRARLVAVIDKALDHGNRTQRDFNQGQSQLFGDSDLSDESSETRLLDVNPWSESEELAFEKEALGLYLSGHPLDQLADDLKRANAIATIDLTETKEEVLVGGIVSESRLLKTRRGKRMAVFSLDDPLGSVEVVVFPEPFEKHSALIENDRVVLVRGRFEHTDDTKKILASEVLPIEALDTALVKRVKVSLKSPPHDRDTFKRLAELFDHHRGDRPVEIVLEVESKGGPQRVRLGLSAVRIKPSRHFINEVEHICGVGTVILR